MAVHAYVVGENDEVLALLQGAAQLRNAGRSEDDFSVVTSPADRDNAILEEWQAQGSDGRRVVRNTTYADVMSYSPVRELPIAYGRLVTEISQQN